MPAAGDIDLLNRELSRVGLLLEHDGRLPSATTLLAGGPVLGSWWGHPHGQRIYAVLETFVEREGALCVKLVNAKRTYVHRALWPAFLVLVRTDEKKRASLLSPLARRVREHVLEKGHARGDELVAARFGPPRELTKAGSELETALLLHVDSVHTASGAHTKIYRSWPTWAKGSGVRDTGLSPAQARRELAAAIERLGADALGRPGLTIPLL